jgi:FkbM family methyltransferase
VPIRRHLLRYLDPQAELVVFDIGACEGEDSVRYARLFPRARIFSAEPVPANVERMHALLAAEGLGGRVHVLACALAATAGTATLHVSSGQPAGQRDGADLVGRTDGAAGAGDTVKAGWDYGNKSSSLYAPAETLAVHPWLRFDTCIEVPVRTLADVAAGEGIDRIDFVHLDVQGAELDVLRGAGRWLAGIGLVWLEVEARPLYRGQPLRDDVEAFMRGHGFVKVLDTVGRVAGDQLWRRATLTARPWRARWHDRAW